MNFKQFLSICILTAAFSFDAVSGRFNRHNSNIINGTSTIIENHPYQVQVYGYEDGGLYMCGGSILNINTIITVAHCVYGADPNSMYIIAGTTERHKGGIKYKVIKTFVHSNYKKLNGKVSNYPYNDIAILKLKKNLKFSNKVNPISIQPRNKLVPAGIIATSTGWGMTNVNDPYSLADILQKVEVGIISQKKCSQIFSDWAIEISDTFLCVFAHGKGICNGDSGGPFVVNNTLIGMASYGISCAHSHYPTLYTNVSYHHDFITKYL